MPHAQGAERQLRLPADLRRFGQLPMKVEFTREDDKYVWNDGCAI